MKPARAILEVLDPQTNRRGQPLTSQAIDMLLRNRLYIGIVDVPDFGIRDQRGDFDPLIREEIFY